MPKTKKESFVFTFLMCSIMVFGMSIWNLVLVGQFSWGHVFAGFLPAFILAFCLDVFLVGPIAKTIAFRLLHHLPQPVKIWQKILVISGTMALFMVTFMSLYGLWMNGVGLSLASYARAFLSNVVMALPLNFLLAGPLARLLLEKLLPYL
ncbi:DUF2798 domain-containing protein [Streptococcus himalayensis]|uniref:DUF2798 domain-containing protein n=1 Tax=Streptococcus himalayensis TaxID=1888195 RepID=A0A917EEH6_9STRE|nr:DUF2798 domain-containing protein [Streptococcus himalayensis]GGE31899.1 hypothetical protein GCM10011510_11490 [Streptococcus himalayensis]